ncbi:hypothetical protein pb186bvf_014027 [Paramecium bursaria]
MAEQDEVVKLFAAKYATQSKLKNQILLQSIEKILKDKQVTTQQMTKLKTKLKQSQTQQQFFPVVEEKPQPPQIQPSQTQPSIMKSTKTNFNHRMLPFQKAPIKQQSDDSDASERPPKSVYFVDRNDEDEWAALLKFNANLYQNELKRQQELKQLKKQKMKEELDQQVIMKQQKKQQEKEQEDRYHKFEQKLLQHNNQVELEKQSQQKMKIMSIQNERKMQLKTLQKQKTHQQKEEQQYKQQLNQKYEQDYQNELSEQQRIKKSKRDFLYNVMKLSEADKEQQLKQEKEQHHFEQLNFNKYGQILDQLEQRRLLEQQKRNEKIAKQIAFNDNKQKLIEEDERRFRFWADIEKQKHEEAEQQKKQKLNSMKSQTIQTLSQQVQLKKEKLNDQKKIDDLQGQIWKQDTEQYYKEEQEKLNKIKMIKQQHKQILESQISEKLKPERGDKMTLTELLQKLFKKNSFMNQRGMLYDALLYFFLNE